ncbi:hypothetical protein [Xylella fastidiosa]|nr:hypothetical protein [Xylella fastidiosa]UIX80793.1 hypothetical protein LZ756_09950 [Xylella fastidiosa subsp. sandyi]
MAQCASSSLTVAMIMDESKVLVNELVDAAIDRTVSLAHLLRLALVVASRLELPELVAWINRELNGYSSDDVPDCRRVSLQWMVEDPDNGWVPFFPPPKIAKQGSQDPIKQSVHVLIQMTQEPPGTSFSYFHPELECRLPEVMRRSFGEDVRLVRVLSNLQVHGILEKVRDKVLQWALNLEAKGVLGKGRLFSPQEKQIVKNDTVNVGGVKNSTDQIRAMGSHDAHTHTHTVEDIDALLPLIGCLRKAIDEGTLLQDIHHTLQANLMTLQAQAISSKPEWPAIKMLLHRIKAMLDNSDVAATEVLSHLRAIR